MIPILVDLENLSDVVVNEVVKKTVYDEFIKKVNNIKTTDTSDLVWKVGYNSIVSKTEKKVNDYDNSSKYFTTQQSNKMTPETFDAKLKETHLASKNDIADL